MVHIGSLQAQQNWFIGSKS